MIAERIAILRGRVNDVLHARATTALLLPLDTALRENRTRAANVRSPALSAKASTTTIRAF